MYYRSRLKKNRDRYTKFHTRRNSFNSIKRKEERRSYLSDVILKAVTTGVFIFSIFLNIVLILVILIMSISQKSRLAFQGKETSYTKEYIKGDSSYSKSFVIIDINGIISEHQSEVFYDFGTRESMVEGVKKRLKLIEKNPDVKGIILLVDSPGGTVTASDMIYHEIAEFKRSHSIPIITFIKNIGASGAYYIASSTDYIISYPTAITGSIGVIMYNFNFKNLMDKYGVRYVVIKSGKHKDMISPFKEIDPEEIKWMQGIVNELLERFIGVVKLSRKNLSIQQVRALSDGKVYTAPMAKKVGLIDEVGYFDDALKYLEKLTDISSYSVYRYVRRKELGGLLDIITKSRSKAVYKRYLPAPVNRIDNGNGIETYYLMTEYVDRLNRELLIGGY